MIMMQMACRTIYRLGRKAAVALATGVTGFPDASVNDNLTIVNGAPEKGCGACIQFTCVDAVSAQPFMHANIMFVHSGLCVA